MTVQEEPPPLAAVHDDGARYLIHCPSSVDHYSLDAPSLSPERFVLCGELPRVHPLFNDGPGHFHDPQVIVEAVGEIGAFVGHRYFGVPQDRVGLFYRLALDLTALPAWRVERGGRADGPSRMTTRWTATPENTADGALRSLKLRLDALIDDSPCATGTAGMVFLPPELHSEHLAYSGALSGAPEPAERPTPAAPADVGRGRDENVVVSRPTVDSRGRLSTWLLTRGVSPVITGPREELTGFHLCEALRQTALLAGRRIGGLDPARCAPVGVDVRFRTQTALDLPLRCVAIAGERAQDACGRPVVPVTLTVTRHRHTVAEAHVTVVQDY